MSVFAVAIVSALARASLGGFVQKSNARRNLGSTWKSRLAEARARAAGVGPRLSPADVASLQRMVSILDVTSPENMALLWSGRDILTGVPMKEEAPNGAKWWDKLSCRDAELLSALEIACRLEDTEGGQFLARLQLHYEDTDPLFAVASDLWARLSHRFAAATTGRVEIICEGAFENSVLRSIELDALLSNGKVTAINGLARGHFPSDAAAAFRLLRRWDVERARRYSEFIASDANATPHERATAHDDSREIRLWYEQDFFDDLGPRRELPALPEAVVNAIDQSMGAGTWKYSSRWRDVIRRETEDHDHESDSPRG